MKMTDPTTGWLNIFEVPCFDLAEVARGNNKYIEKSYAGVIHMFNQKWLCRYSYPREVVFDNIYKFRQDLTPLLKEFTITLICTYIKNPKSNNPVECISLLFRVHIRTLDIGKAKC